MCEIACYTSPVDEIAGALREYTKDAYQKAFDEPEELSWEPSPWSDFLFDFCPLAQPLVYPVHIEMFDPILGPPHSWGKFEGVRAELFPIFCLTFALWRNL